MRYRKSLLITVFLAVCAIVSVFAGRVERSRITGSSQPMCSRHAFCGSLSADTLSQIFSIADSLAPGDVAPSFPGGVEALERYIKNHLIYPTIARENGIEGRVSVAFTVMPDGSLSGIRLIHAVDPSLDREAARLVKSMPFWTPGRRHARSHALHHRSVVQFVRSSGAFTLFSLCPCSHGYALGCVLYYGQSLARRCGPELSRWRRGFGAIHQG